MLGRFLEPVLAEDRDAAALEQRGGDAGFGLPAAAEGPVVDEAAPTRRASFLQDRQPRPALASRPQSQLGAAEERVRHVKTGARAHAGRAVQYGGAACSLDFR